MVPNVTPVAAIAPATILAATAGAAERCDVCEGLTFFSEILRRGKVEMVASFASSETAFRHL